MTDVRRVTQLPVDVSTDEVARLLGYADRIVPDRVEAMLGEVAAEAGPLVHAAFASARMATAQLAASPFLRRLDDAMLCVVTIGEGVEEAVAACDRRGDIGKALIMNVYGSAAAEAAADAAGAIVRKEVAREGLRCSRRFSPGYGGWDVAEQRWILPALDAAGLGVRLTDGYMMIPRKSITFAMSVGLNPMEMRNDNACDGCELINCSYRRRTVIREEDGRTWTTFIGPESNYCPLDRWS